MADKYPIDLGSKPPGDPMSYPMKMDRSKYYPTLHLDWDNEYDLPDSGTMEVTFNKTSESKSTHNGKTRYSVTLEIKSIEEVSKKSGDDEDAGESEPDESTGDRLDRMAKEADEEEAD